MKPSTSSLAISFHRSRGSGADARSSRSFQRRFRESESTSGSMRPGPLDARFHRRIRPRGSAGRSTLGQRPAILALVYYRCTMLCSYILNGVVSGLRPLSLRPGRDFDVVAISIDPSEDAQVAVGEARSLRPTRIHRGGNRRLALSDRRREGHPRGCGRRRIPLSLRSENADVHARQRCHGADPGRPRLALFLWRRIRAERFEARPDRGIRTTGSGRPSIRSCCSATTTTRPPESTARL